ncbi:TadE/TadG family type IV pilus assembly protein [Novosphingobium olei]|uniref:Pilus assembly protein n=1 Tax=Novosphingobium olei TaxID=2728851 RepID=A0A7Y0GAF6_9SPHN|nr:TadE/TadG family type IV pilus assembly protein [Novosphingobium olei]NML94043.1 pilus assembly protein [Novosphingobium olei]BEV00550.1 pilus assembly protein [Novosphingobium olei]
MKRTARPLAAKSTGLRAATEGSATIEFALIGPIFILMMMAVFQFSVVMQSYNALGSAAADVQRQVVTQSQAGNVLTSSQMRDIAIARASSAPYFLNSASLTVTAALASPQRITGASEYTLTMSYDAPIFVWITPLSFTTTYTRSIFVKA